MQSLRVVASLALIAFLAAPGRAQCPLPDGLDVPGAACSPATASPKYRAFNQKVLGICWNNCGVDAVAPYTVTWNNLTPFVNNTLVSCAWYRARVRLFSGSALALDGMMQLSYSRTWLEAGIPGQLLQVWRYLVNGDMRVVSSSATPCGIPPCAVPHSKLIRFTGYIDWAYDCATGQYSAAWMLTHACDAIDHAAGSPRAGSFHPGRSYTFVGPGAGFVVGAGTTVEAGALSDEALRAWDVPVLPARCLAEEPILAPAFIAATGAVCLCGSGPANWFEGQLNVFGAFGTTVTPFPGSDPFRSFPIGQWTNPAVFPGVEEVRWNCNEALWVECTGVGRQEFYFGVTTAGGYQAFSITGSGSAPLPQTFIDQSNSVLLPANVAIRNVPYRSDHVVNLNQ